MADARLVLGFDTAGALATLTAFSGKARAALSTPLPGSSIFDGPKRAVEGLATSLGRTALAITGLGGAVAIFHQMAAAIGAAADQQTRLNATLRSFDSAPALNALKEQNAELDKMAAGQAAIDKVGLFGQGSTFAERMEARLAIFRQGVQASREALTDDLPEEDAAQARTRALANIDLEQARAQKKLQATIEQTQFQRRQLAQSDLLQRGDLPGAEANARAIEMAEAARSKAARDELIADQRKRQSELLLQTGATPESVEKTFKQELLNLDEELALNGQKRQQANQRAIEDLRQLVTETANLREQLERDRTTQGAVAESQDAERAAKRRALELETVGQLREAERGLAQEIADLQGRTLNDITETNAARRTQAVATARAEVEAIQAATAARLQGLGGRQAASEGQLAALSGLPSTPEVERRRIALLGTIQETQGQLTEAAREGAAARAQVEIKAAAELRSLAIKEAGERVALLGKTLAKENQLRTEARSLLAQALSNRPDVDEFSVVNRASLEADTAQQRREDERVREEFARGQLVNQRELEAANQRLGFQEQLQRFGGLGAATDIAGTTPGRIPGELTGAEQFTQAQQQIATLSAEVSASIAGIKGSFADSLGQVPALMASTMEELVAIVDTGKSKLGASLADMVQGQLTRAFADAPSGGCDGDRNPRIPRALLRAWRLRPALAPARDLLRRPRWVERLSVVRHARRRSGPRGGQRDERADHHGGGGRHPGPPACGCNDRLSGLDGQRLHRAHRGLHAGPHGRRPLELHDGAPRPHRGRPPRRAGVARGEGRDLLRRRRGHGHHRKDPGQAPRGRHRDRAEVRREERGRHRPRDCGQYAGRPDGPR